MKITNEDLLKLKINIAIDDDVEFQDTATLVDRPDFLEDVKRIRRLINLEEIIKIKRGYWWWDYESFQKAKPKEFRKLGKEAEELVEKYRRPLHKTTIVQAILFGKVLNLNPPLIYIIKKDTKFYNPLIAIFPTQRTTDGEIRNALKQVKKMYALGAANSDFEYPLKYSSVSPPHQLIKTQREWYWMRISGMKYKEVADKWNNLYPNFKPVPDEVRVTKDIKTYEKLLK